MRRIWGRRLAWATVSVAALCAGPASAQTVIAFGDSLVDNGNLSLATNGARPGPGYFAGRFSNGPTYAEIVAGGAMQPAGALSLARRPVSPLADRNYAFGGARSDRAQAVPPGVPQQIDLFQAQGGRFGPGDLVLLNGGPNNIFQAFAAVAGGANPATIGTSALGAAGDTAASAARLAGLGAPTIAVTTIPDLGRTPLFNGNARNSVVATQASDAYNAALASRLFTVAAANPQSDIHLVDVQPLFRDVVSNPARYGYANATDACLALASCARAPAAVQNGFVFFDDVHPTAPGHELFGQLVLDHLTAGAQAAQAAALTEVAAVDRLAGESAVRDRARMLLANTNAIEQGADSVEPLTAPIAYGSVYATLEGTAFDRDTSGRLTQYDYRAGTLRIGADHRPSERFLFGGALSGTVGEVRDTPLGFDARALSVDVYGTVTRGPAYLTVTGGVARIDFDDLNRRSLVRAVTQNGGDTDGIAANAGAEVGYAFAFGAFTATPTIGLTYLNVGVDGFAEDGLAARIGYGDMDRDVFHGAANLHLAYAGGLAGRRATFTGRLGYEGTLSDGGDGIVSRIVGSPARPVAAGFDDLPGRGFVVGAGAEVDLGEQLALSAKYSIGFGDELGTSHNGGVTLGFRF